MGSIGDILALPSCINDFSGREPQGIICTGFSHGPDVLAVAQPTVAKE